MSFKSQAEPDVMEDDDPALIPEDVKEFVKKAHRQQQESRPDESWRITPPEPKEPIAPYKRDDEDLEREQEEMPQETPSEIPAEIPHFAEGGVMDPNDLLGQIAPVGTGTLAPSPAPQPPNPPPVAAPAAPAPMATPKAPVSASPALTDQDYMSRANKMLGLDANQSASFMKMLGDRSQKAQLGAGIAGIGDAIASGGTLGKVNPGALNKSEDLIQGREKAGIEGMQVVRGNQEKAQEIGDKLQTRDPNSPLSKYAQKAYAGVGKKIGIDLSHASASLIGDVTGKGVEALKADYEQQLKTMGLDLQKQQVAATIANQKAERAAQAAAQRQEAQKTLASRGVIKRGIDTVTGNEAVKGLEVTAGVVGPFGRETVRDNETYEWSPETGKYHLKNE